MFDLVLAWCLICLAWCLICLALFGLVFGLVFALFLALFGFVVFGFVVFALLCLLCSIFALKLYWLCLLTVNCVCLCSSYSIIFKRTTSMTIVPASETPQRSDGVVDRSSWRRARSAFRISHHNIGMNVHL